MCEASFDVFCYIMASKYVVNCGFCLTILECILWAQGEKKVTQCRDCSG